MIMNSSQPKYLSMLLVLLVSLISQNAFTRSISDLAVEALAEDEINETNLTGSISGTVKEAGTGELLIGANVYVKGTTKGTATDVNGEFLIYGVEEGDLILVVSYLGYQQQEIPVTVKEDETLELTVELVWEGFEGGEVLITAQAQGQIAAINEQVASNTIVNVVSRDRIEDVPDVNAAESLGRLPGVSIQRSNGEANKIAIRGLSPKFNTVSINGVRIPSTGNDRSADLSLISSNMLDGIEVSKAITPDMDGDALGGSVNLRLRRAPEEFFGDLRIQNGYTGLQEEYGNYKIVASGGQRFFDNKVGLIANVNLDNNNRSADVFLADNENRRDVRNNNEFRPSLRSISLEERDLVRKRIGFSFIADYKLAKGDLVVNAIYNRLSSEGAIRQNILNASTNRHDYNASATRNNTSIFSISGMLEQNYGWLKFDTGVSFSSTINKNPGTFGANFFQLSAAEPLLLTDEILFGDPRNLPLAFVYDDSSSTGLNNIYRSTSRNRGDELTINANFEIPFEISANIDGSVKMGGKFKKVDRFNDNEQIGRQMYYGADAEARSVFAMALPEIMFPPSDTPYTLHLFQDDYSRSNFLNGDYPLGYTVQTSLIERGFNELLKYDGLYLNYTPQTSFGSDYSGEEEYSAAYIMTTLNLGKWITLIPGVRYEQEHSSYTANVVKFIGDISLDRDLSGILSDTTSTRDLDFLLPMVHLKVNPVEWLSIRLAYTETITRPDFRQYAPLTYVDPFGNFVNAANSQLKSSKARSYDASVSVYQNKLGFFTASYFSKEIEGLIRDVRFPWINGQQILPELSKEELNISGSPLVNTFINNPEVATVEGIELDWQTNFWYLPSLFKGLVLSVNYTILSSETQYPVNFTERIPTNTPPFFEQVLMDTLYVGRIPDQPSNIGNFTIGYDYKGFSARLSYYFQNDNFTGSFGDQFYANGEFIEIDDLFTDSIKRYDLTVKQTFKEKYEVYANFNNLTNEYDQTFYKSFGQFPVNQEYYGFTMDVGFRMKF